MKEKNKKIYFLDLFAGAGGLSEGFIQASFYPIAYVEMDKNACNTLKTRSAYYYLKNHNILHYYEKYLLKEIDQNEFYSIIPGYLFESVINEEISKRTIKSIFDRIDKIRGNKKIDVIIGGPPCQAYSLIGRGKMRENVKKDSRNYLFRYYKIQTRSFFI